MILLSCRRPPTPLWSAAGPSARGAPTSCARPACGTVVLIEKGVLGQGASSRAAGVVRVQGGTPAAVRLGQWSRAFYLRQRDEIGTDSGFTQQGYLLPAFTEPEVAAARGPDRDAALARAAGPLAGLRRGRRGQPDPRARARRSARPTATRTGTSRRRATSPPTPRRWSPAA